MTVVRRELRLLAGIRPIAGRLQLVVFLVAAQLVPLAHLATHRHDHTHGPDAADGHAATHADGRPHDHDHDDADRHDEVAATGADHGHDHDGASPPASPEHGRASAAHFDLALLGGPPPPFFPLPAEALAPPPDIVARWRHAPALPQPPARGPPHLH